MPSLKQLDQHYLFSLEMHDLVQATQEITVMKIQKVRESSLETRTYMEGIFDIFFDIHSAKRRAIEQLLKKKSARKAQLVPKSGKKKSVIVFVSANHLFTGDILTKVFQLFAAEVRKETADIVIIGKIGKQLFEQAFGDRYHFLYSEISISQPESEQLKSLVTALLEYEKIDVYEGKYMSLVDQRPVTINLNGEATLMEARQTEVVSQRRFLFEPSLDTIIVFFETQITATLVRLTLDESRLANLGSRITTLEASLHNLERDVEQLERRRKFLIRGVQNRQQLQRLAGISCWT